MTNDSDASWMKKEEALSRLVGARLTSVQFILNYLILGFDEKGALKTTRAAAQLLHVRAARRRERAAQTEPCLLQSDLRVKRNKPPDTTMPASMPVKINMRASPRRDAGRWQELWRILYQATIVNAPQVLLPNSRPRSRDQRTRVGPIMPLTT